MVMEVVEEVVVVEGEEVVVAADNNNKRRKMKEKTTTSSLVSLEMLTTNKLKKHSRKWQLNTTLTKIRMIQRQQRKSFRKSHWLTKHFQTKIRGRFMMCMVLRVFRNLRVVGDLEA